MSLGSCLKLVLLSILSLLINTARAELPMDVVFDLDQTLATLIHEEPSGDWLARSPNSSDGLVTINYQDDSPQTSKYRVYEGVPELLQKLKELQSKGIVRVSFFSGGKRSRNMALLEAIKLPDGTSARELAMPSDSPTRIFNGEHLVRTNAPEKNWFRDKYKKDLTLINSELDDVIIIDDIKDFVPEEQKRNVLWIDDSFPYPERSREVLSDPPLHLIEAERKKFQWISEKLLGSIELRMTKGIPLSQAVQENTLGETPLSHLKSSILMPYRCRPNPIIERLFLQNGL